MVGQRVGGVVEIGQPVAPAVEAGDLRHRAAVDENAELIWRRCRRVQAQSGHIAKGNAWALDDRKKAERPRALAQHLRAQDLERAGKALVFGDPQGKPPVRQNRPDREGEDHAARRQSRPENQPSIQRNQCSCDKPHGGN
jgi:hypothetical protein